jgi:hypothetical protein
MESVIQENSPTSATTLSPPLSETDSTGMVVPRIWCSIDVPFPVRVLPASYGRLRTLTCLTTFVSTPRAPVPGVLAEAVAVGPDEALGGAVVITERQRTREIQLAYVYAAAGRSRILEIM